MIFFRRKKTAIQKAEAETTKQDTDHVPQSKVSMQDIHKPILNGTVAIVSAKGGVGKTLIASELTALTSINRGSALAIDLDFSNSSLTSLYLDLFESAKISDNLRAKTGHEERTAFGYFINSPVLCIRNECEKLFGVTVGKGVVAGYARYDKLDTPFKLVRLGRIHLIPSSPTRKSGDSIKKLARLPREEIEDRVREFMEFIRFNMAREGYPVAIIDIPSLSVFDTYKLSGIRELYIHVLDQVDHVIVAYHYTNSSTEIGNFITFLREHLNFIRYKTRAIIITQVPKEIKLENTAIYKVLVKNLMTKNIYRIRYSKAWDTAYARRSIPGSEPNNGSIDLISMGLRIGLLTREILEKLKLGV